MTTHRLIISPGPGKDDTSFVVTRAVDNHQSDRVIVDPPSGMTLEGQREIALPASIRWYLEQFLDYPFPPRTERAQRIRQALQAWGRATFDALFGARSGRDFYREAARDGLDNLVIEVRNNDPGVLAWPWEAMEDQSGGILSLACQIERRLVGLDATAPLDQRLSDRRVRILLVIARPYEQDVAYGAVARPLVEMISEQGLPADVTVLRPPTLARLRAVLRQNPGTFHVLHFDGHGGYGTRGEAPPLGRLVFETQRGQPDPVDSVRLSKLLREHRVPVVVLNACQSGMFDEAAADVFASVATGLLSGGARSVVAMAYALYASGAKHFLHSFYQRLFQTGSIGHAVQAGRQQMFENPGRVCAVGMHPLADWMVPVLYQQDETRFAFVTKSGAQNEVVAAGTRGEPNSQNRSWFVGRDGTILILERALRSQRPAILVDGLSGVGKTTLAREFVRWITQTGGFHGGTVWIPFDEIRSAEAVVTRLAAAILGAEDRSRLVSEKLDKLISALRETPYLIVWDNFESARGIEGSSVPGLLSPADLETLRAFLRRLHASETKVLITSRTSEDWLGDGVRHRVHIGGLVGEARWELCHRIMDDLGLPANRDDLGLVDLMETLGGHPLMMRAVLPRLGSMSAGDIVTAIRGNLPRLGSVGDEFHDKLLASLRFVELNLPDDLRTLLLPLSLHESYLQLGALKVIVTRVPGHWKEQQCDALLEALAVRGLVTLDEPDVYRLHPALSGYLRGSNFPDPLRESWERGFVEMMGGLANAAAQKSSRDAGVFRIHHDNFYSARALALKWSMHEEFAAIVQAQALHAQREGLADEAEQLYQTLSASNVMDKTIVYHQLGIAAQIKGEFDTAESWYLRTLPIVEAKGDETEKFKLYHLLGMVSAARGSVDDAESWYRKALEIAERVEGQGEVVATIQSFLGLLYFERGDDDEATKWLTKSLTFGGVTSSASYRTLADIASRRGDVSGAKQLYLAAMEIETADGNDHSQATTFSSLGMLAQKVGDFDEAEEWYLKALSNAERREDQQGMANTSWALAILDALRGDLAAATNWLVRAGVFYRDYSGPRAMFSEIVGTFGAVLAGSRGFPGMREELLGIWRSAGLPIPDGPLE